MIIELYGPPGGGKTTFSHMIARELRDEGLAVDLHLSRRPAERVDPAHAPRYMFTHHQHVAVVIRFLRPLSIFHKMLGSGRVRAEAVQMASRLLASLPQSSLFRGLRLRQYLIRVGIEWFSALNSDRISVFDQAFIQAIYSMALTTDRPDQKALDRAFSVAPRPHVVVRVDAPECVLRERLVRRLKNQSAFERILERDVANFEKSGSLLESISRYVAGQGGRHLHVDSTNPASVRAAAHQVIEAVRIEADVKSHDLGFGKS